MKKKKIKCKECNDTGYIENPFDQLIPCSCKSKRKKTKKADYKGFVLHMWEWNELGIPYNISDLRELAKMYNTPIPKKYKEI